MQGCVPIFTVDAKNLRYVHYRFLVIDFNYHVTFSISPIFAIDVVNFKP